MKSRGAIAWRSFLIVLLLVFVMVSVASSFSLIGLFEIGIASRNDPNVNRGLTESELASAFITAVIGMAVLILLRKMK